MTSISATESSRFGLRIGRVTLPSGSAVDAVRAVLRDDQPDVLIVRAPADDPAMPAALARIGAHVTLTADMLIYWRWDASERSAPRATVGSVTATEDDDEIAALVRGVFAGYTNHYAANPLLAPSDALDGYVEWAQLLVRGGATCLVLQGSGGGPAGFGLIDWVEPVPDVRLAGIVPDARGRGAYRDLVAHMMRNVLERGGASLQISTQAHNTGVMRAWAEAGWRPVSTQTTFHVIRSALLSQRSPGAPARDADE